MNNRLCLHRFIWRNYFLSQPLACFPLFVQCQPENCGWFDPLYNTDSRILPCPSCIKLKNFFKAESNGSAFEVIWCNVIIEAPNNANSLVLLFQVMRTVQSIPMCIWVKLFSLQSHQGFILLLNHPFLFQGLSFKYTAC